MWKKLRKNYKRVIAFMLTMAMTFTNMAANMTAVFAAAGEEEEALFVVDGLELAQALREAKKNGEDFDYSSLDLKARTKKLKGQYEKMLKDGNVYQLDMEIDDSYAPDGTGMEVFYNEETDDVIFLFINGSDLVVNFRASIDGYETEPLTIGPNAANVELDDEEAADFIEDAATKLPEKEAPKAEVVGGTEAEDADGEAEDADQADEEKAGEANADESVDDEADETEDQADAEENGEAEDQTEKETEAEEVESEEETTEAEEEVETEEETEAEEPETEEEIEAEDEAEAEDDAEPEEDVPEEVAAVTVSLHEVQLVATDDNLEETLEEPETTEAETEADEQELEEEKDEDVAEPAEEDEENESEKKEEADAPETEKGTEAVEPKADDTTASENKEEVVDPENLGNISDSENEDQETTDPEKQGDVTDAENPEETDGTEEGKAGETGESKTDGAGEIPAEGTEAGETVVPADGTVPAETETTAPEEETKEDKIVKDDGEQFLDDTETMGVLEGKDFTAVALWENTMNAAAYRVSMEAMQVVLENIEIPEEPVGPTAYAAETDDASFTVEAPEGAFEEEVELHVEKIEDEDQLQNLSDQAAEAMDEKDSSKVVGFVAYDITFVSVETGEKVEPAVPVKVGMQFKTLPEDVKEEDVTGISVVHVPEEAMADAEETEEAVEAEDAEKPAAEVVETITGELDLSDVSFDAESFSPYVIYLNGNAGTVEEASDFESLKKAIETANTGDEEKYIIEIKPEEGRTKEDAGSIVVEGTLDIKKDITIKGGEITRSKDVTIFNVTDNGKLTLEDIVFRGGGKEHIASGSFYTPSYYVSSSYQNSPIICAGNLTLGNGTIIEGFAGKTGGALQVVDGGKVTIQDGAEIRNNTAYSSNSNYMSCGGGIYIDNGGIVTMEGGLITENKAANADGRNNTGSAGGGVAVAGGGTFIMNGGSITENSSDYYGNGTRGGGICVGNQYTPMEKRTAGAYAEFNGGLISGNNSAIGGGMYVHNGSTAIITNAKIVNNIAGSYGGGLWLCMNGRIEKLFEGEGILLTDNESPYAFDYASENGSCLYVPDVAPDGTPMVWYQDCNPDESEVFCYNGAPIEDMGSWWGAFDTEARNRNIVWRMELGLRSTVNERAYKYDYKVAFSENHALTWGGAIACNGKITFGNPDAPTPKLKTGDLTVSKIVTGSGDINKEFEFTVTLNDTTVNGTFEGMEFVNGVATFTLKHGESKTAKGLPEGIAYTVKEDTYEGYTTTYDGEVKEDGATGIIETEKEIKVEVENNKREEEKFGDLTVSKTVTGIGGDTTKEFNFKVTLSDTSISGTYGDGDTAMKFTNGVADFTLKHGESKTAKGLPEGTEYTVKEETYEGYSTTYNGTADENGAKGTIESKKETIVAVENQKREEKKVGDLRVTKTVTGSRGNTAKDFSFVVTLSDRTINGTYGDMNFTNGVAEFTLRHGQRRTASGLPAGITYTVTESDNDGYTVTSTGEEGTIPADGMAEAAFTNYRGGGGGGSSDSSGGNPPSNPSTTTTTTIENPEVPLASLPNETPEPVSIEESEVPLAALLPKTGDSRNMSMWLMLFSVAGIGMLGAALGMKKKGNEDGDN